MIFLVVFFRLSLFRLFLSPVPFACGRGFFDSFFDFLNHAVNDAARNTTRNAAGETRTPILLPAADFASFHGFRRPQARPKAAPEVWRLDFLFTMSPTFACRLLGERRQVSTPSPSRALSSVSQGLARDWHRYERRASKALLSSDKRSPFLTLAHRTVSRAGTHVVFPPSTFSYREGSWRE